MSPTQGVWGLIMLAIGAVCVGGVLLGRDSLWGFAPLALGVVIAAILYAGWMSRQEPDR